MDTTPRPIPEWLKAYARWAVRSWLGVTVFQMTAGWYVLTFPKARGALWNQWIETERMK